MPKSHPKRADDCDCLACRIQIAIVDECAQDGDAPVFAIDATQTLAALIPTVGMLMSAIQPGDAESWWREVLTARSRTMLPEGMELGQSYKGRA